MVKTRSIQVRVNKEEYDFVMMNMKNLGYTNISGYVRELTLEPNLILKKKLLKLSGRVNQILDKLEK